jgi:hypothetical protein
MQVICSNCKTANPDTNKYCGKCGVLLEHTVTVEEPAKQLQKSSSKFTTAEQMLIGLGVLFVVCIFCSVLILFIQSTPTTTSVEPAINVEEFKAKARQIPYDELARYTENYVGEPVTYRGKVVQIIEGSGQNMDLRVEVTEGEYGLWDDLVWLNYEGPRLLEDDIIQFWGIVDGRTSYTTVLGANVTVPEITAFALIR